MTEIPIGFPSTLVDSNDIRTGMPVADLISRLQFVYDTYGNLPVNIEFDGRSGQSRLETVIIKINEPFGVPNSINLIGD